MKEPVQRPRIETIEQAEKWIGIHHHMLCEDSGRFVKLLDRVWWLEQSWWFRLTHPSYKPCDR